MINFQFKLLQKSDLLILFDWLGLPHVAEWWRESRDYKIFYAKYSKKIIDPTIGQFLIYYKTEPIGFISWYEAAYCPIGTESFPEPTCGIDLFIADTNYIGKGYGQKIIKQFIKEIIMPMNPKKIITDPEITNMRSIHVFEKVGFKKSKVVEATDGAQMVMAQLMEMRIYNQVKKN
jgi:aminoglycoside 6'-N-acetyltransferase